MVAILSSMEWTVRAEHVGMFYININFGPETLTTFNQIGDLLLEERKITSIYHMFNTA